MNNTPEKALSNLLKQEKAAILKGEFKTIDDLAPQKEVLFNDLMRAGIDAQKLSTLQSLLHRNQGLLQAAIEGVGSARARILALREVHQELRVYDKEGTFEKASTTQASLCKRT